MPADPESTDIAIVGAGAAGLMAAIMAGRHARGKLKIVLLDTRSKVGAKILMSGGTRCNLTNTKVTSSDYHGGPRHFIQHIFEAFTPSQTMDFFESLGVGVVLEPTGKYFPKTHSGKTVLEALLKEAQKLGVTLKSGVKITEIRKTGEGDFDLGPFLAKRVVLACGGLSYPETGSDGTGFKIAESFGHTVVPTAPALTPLTTHDHDWKLLSGVSLEANLSFFEGGRKKAESQGSFLFTHVGFSGPAALDLSRHWACCSPKEKPHIEASFLPHQTQESLRSHFENFKKKHPRKSVKNFFVEEYGLPLRFCETFFEKTGIDGAAMLGECRASDWGKLAHRLLNYPLEVTGVVGYKKAEATAGGVDLKEVKVATMESKLVPGLYFSGEMLDVDGRIGGFNFQWAWSSGKVAGVAAAESLVKV
jgi:predicted Rossmann fold flavoprotein